MKCSSCGGSRFDGLNCKYCGEIAGSNPAALEVKDKRQGLLRMCHTLRIGVPLPSKERMEYAIANPRERRLIAGRNSNKLKIIDALLTIHQRDGVLIVARHHEVIENHLGLPCISEGTDQSTEAKLLGMFASGRINRLFMTNSRSVFPNADVFIQVDGRFNSFTGDDIRRIGGLEKYRQSKIEFSYVLISNDCIEKEDSEDREHLLRHLGYLYRHFRVPPLARGMSGLPMPAPDVGSPWESDLAQAILAYQSEVHAQIEGPGKP